MPEEPQPGAWCHRMKRWKTAFVQKMKCQPKGFLRIFPRCFATGTPQRHYTTCTVDRTNYTDHTEPVSPDYAVNGFDAGRAKGEAFEYLLKQLAPGEIYWARRGKQMIIAVGHHLIVISFGLESSIIRFDRDDFDKIVALCQPGPNADKRKAEQLRRFAVPSELVEPATNDVEGRSLTVFAAIVTEQDVWAFLDFSRLIRIHIISRDTVWQEHELQLTSKLWPSLWLCFGDGPDWNLEPEACLLGLDQWRQETLLGLTATAFAAICKVLCDNNRVFNGFGRHLANDFLHTIGVFPGTPAIVICEDDVLFDRFRCSIPIFMDQWKSDVFLRRTANNVNSLNPLAYNTTSNTNYISSYVHVYRRALCAKVPATLYNMLMINGYLDEDHTIGQPYLKDPLKLATGGYKRLPVYYYAEPLKSYSVIVAKCPDSWITGPRQVAPDLLDAGYSTTLGQAEFHEYKSNKINPDVARVALAKGGRPKKPKSTGLRGRPRKQLTASKCTELGRRTVNPIVAAAKSKLKENIPSTNLAMLGTTKRTRSQSENDDLTGQTSAIEHVTKRTRFR